MAVRMHAAPLPPEFAHAEQLIQAGQFDAARGLLKRLHKLHPKSTDILLQWAIAERFLQHWPEAIALLRKALSWKPNDWRLIDQLAQVLMFSNIGANLQQAITHYAALLKLRPDMHVAGINLVILALRNDLPQPVLAAIPPLLTDATLPPHWQLQCAAACAIATYLGNDTAACARFVEAALAVRATAFDAAGAPVLSDHYYMLLYAEFIRDLLAYRAAQPQYYAPVAGQQAAHVIGESHCLTPAQMVVSGAAASWHCQPHLMMAMKAFFFSGPEENTAKYALTQIIARVPKSAPLIVGFGELDCRPREGLMTQWRREPGYDLHAAIDRLCEGYARFVKRAQLRRSGRTYLVGVPAPNRTVAVDLQPQEASVFTGMIAHFNARLAQEAATQELGFIDLYRQTVDADGWARSGVHLDHVHLVPAVVAQAMRPHLD